MVGKIELAQYFLAILNSSEQYKKWEILSTKESDGLVLDGTTDYLTMNELHTKQKKQCLTDHTQVSVIYWLCIILEKLSWYIVKIHENGWDLGVISVKKVPYAILVRPFTFCCFIFQHIMPI